MKRFTNLRNFVSALSTGCVCGALAYFTLGYVFPPEPLSNISYIAFIGGLLGFAIGVYTGWRWAQNLAENLVVELLEKVILGAIAVVVNQF